MELERESPTAAHWSREQYENLFASTKDELGSRRVAWVVEEECSKQLEHAPGQTPEIHGFLAANHVGSEWELENIVVVEVARRQGLGTLLLEEFVTRARAGHGIAIFLEVRESNQNARSLYRRLGFEEKGVRKDYYADPGEDAILYLLKI